MLTNNEQKERKSRIAAIAGTILFHALVVVSLILLALRSPSDSSDEGGVDVSYNYNIDSLGNIKPEAPVTTEDSNPQINQISADEQKADLEVNENPLVDKKKTEKPNSILSGKPIAIVETPDERTLIHKKPDAGKSIKNSPGVYPKSSGKTEGKFKPVETTGPVKFDDKSGNGIGVWFELAGRGYISLPKPALDKPVDGRINVSVIVNREGKVIFARTVDKGTNITDIHIRLRAENTARKTIFATVIDALEEQRGIITYVFEKQR